MNWLLFFLVSANALLVLYFFTHKKIFSQFYYFSVIVSVVLSLIFSLSHHFLLYDFSSALPIFFLLLSHLILSASFKTIFFGLVLSPLALFVFFIFKNFYKISVIQDFLLTVHIVMSIIALSCFFISATITAMFLIKNYYLKNHNIDWIERQIPSLQKLKGLLVVFFYLSWICFLLALLPSLLRVSFADIHFSIKLLFIFLIIIGQTVVLILYKLKAISTFKLCYSIIVLFLLTIISYPYLIAQ